MGFSWSSCVAQATLLSIAARAGLDSSRVLAADAPLPETLDLAFAVATDDIMIFSTAGPGALEPVVERFEASLAACGAVQNRTKDVAETLNSTCVGVDLVDGRQW